MLVLSGLDGLWELFLVPSVELDEFLGASLLGAQSGLLFKDFFVQGQDITPLTRRRLGEES